jgi:hypothetical protein
MGHRTRVLTGPDWTGETNMTDCYLGEAAIPSRAKKRAESLDLDDYDERTRSSVAR